MSASTSTAAVKAEDTKPAAPAASEAVSYPIANPPMDADEAKAETLRQFEFYFSNANLPFDKFLFKLTRIDNDPPLTDEGTGEIIPPGPGQGWVPIGTLATFKRMQPMRQSLSNAQLADALEPSTLLKLDPSRTKIRRREPIRPSQDAFQRSIYAKGFPDETPTLQAELEAYFRQFGDIVVVRMRRDDSVRPPKFKNSVFVEFADPDQMQAFLDLDPKPKYNGTELLTMSKDAYCQMKMKEKGIELSTEKRGAGEAERGPGSKPGGSHDNRSSKKRFNAFVELRREAMGLPNALTDDDSKARKAPKMTPEEKEAARLARRAEPLEFPFAGMTLKTKSDGSVDDEGVEFPANSVLNFENAGEADRSSWKLLKDAVSVIQQPFFVDFPIGKSAGSIGFTESVSDENFDKLKALNVPIAGKAGEEIVWSRASPEDARKAWLNRANFRAAMMLDQREEEFLAGPARNCGSGGGGGGGRGRGRGGFNKRGGGRGGRGGGRGGFKGNNGRANGTADADEAEAGQKRKRAGADSGAAGDKMEEDARPPTIGTAPKRTKTEDA